MVLVKVRMQESIEIQCCDGVLISFCCHCLTPSTPLHQAPWASRKAAPGLQSHVCCLQQACHTLLPSCHPALRSSQLTVLLVSCMPGVAGVGPARPLILAVLPPELGPPAWQGCRHHIVQAPRYTRAHMTGDGQIQPGSYPPLTYKTQSNQCRQDGASLPCLPAPAPFDISTSQSL
jgi:hypothetical protein